APEVVDVILYSVKMGAYVKPQLSVEERAALLSKLSEEERGVVEARQYLPGQIDRLLLMEDEFLRKHKLGVGEMNKFFREHQPIMLPGKDLYNPIARAKISDCIVIGKMKEVKAHPEGPYHTWVTVSVAQYLKGGSGESEVLVKLITGMRADGTGTGVSSDPEFEEGEEVLLHLSSLAMELYSYVMGLPERYPPGNPYRSVKLCEGYFEIGRKFLIKEGKVAYLSPGGPQLDSVEKVVQGIAAVVNEGQNEGDLGRSEDDR
ncbi:MAG: hypothetical protein V1800_17195, partial [Candidatus Latescibacterota bacterium]